MTSVFVACRDALDTLTLRTWHPRSARLFAKALLAWALARNLVLVPAHEDFWGAESYVLAAFDRSEWTEWVANLLSHPIMQPWYPLFLLGAFVCFGLALFDVRPRLTTALGLFFHVNLANRCSLVNDGGDNLSWLLLALLPFVATHGRVRDADVGAREGFANALSNVAFTLIKLQICAVYLTAGFCKIMGPLWQNGTALYAILQTQNYSAEWIATRMGILWPLAVVGNYFTIAFQVAFPWMVWRHRALPWLLPAGVFLHVGIAAGMALPFFGIVMCLSYLAFFPDAWSDRVLRAFPRLCLPRAEWVRVRDFRRLPSFFRSEP